jgi:hypothetical protein
VRGGADQDARRDVVQLRQRFTAATCTGAPLP